MAAGIGSRFGTGIKQLEPVDDAGHIIMDYSIHDAIEAGFNHVVFIIRKDIEKEFKEVIGDRISSICAAHNVTVDYAFQDINDIPGTLPEGRTKPWGTGQAVLAAKNVIDVQAATARDLFDVASSGILDKFVGGLVNKRRIHNVISFRGWHSEWNGGLQVHYSFLFSFLFSVLKIGFVHFIHDAVHILRGQLSAGK